MADPSRTASVGDGLDGLKRGGLPASAHQRLKEQLLWVRHFPDVEDQQQALRTFKETTNLLPAHWNAASGRVLDDSAATIVPRQPMVLEVGSRLGRYDVTGRIGEGGYTT